MTLLYLAALAAGVVLFVLFPVFARSGEVSSLPTADARKRKSLSEQKERLYEAIQDLDFEYRAGKLSDGDYQAVRSDLVAQAADVISQLDKLAEAEVPAQPPREAHEPRGDLLSESSTEEDEGAAAAGPACSSCEQVNPPGAKFCFQCGERIATQGSCPECGTDLPKEARFCTSCGVSIPA